MEVYWILPLLLLLGPSDANTCVEYSVSKTPNSTVHVGYLYQTLVLGTLTECSSHCVRGAKCKALAYTSTKQCKLFTKSSEDDPTLVIPETGTYYVSRSSIPTGIAGKCSGHTCGENDLCIEKDTGYHCIPVYGGERCSGPPSVANAVVNFADPDSFPWGTGDTVHFNCSTTPGTPGPQVMTCMDIGVWSFSFTC
eukprot:XP_011417937.1 PREDICTED: uncharacterized protein LOC105321360 [Crassostrea gigas]